ncbi:MAG: GNAT family protein [Bacteroidota bacterium]
MLTLGEVSLQTLSLTDKETLAELANNRKIWLNLTDTFPHPYGLEHAEYFLEGKDEQFPVLYFGIHYQGQFCGVISIHPKEDVYKLSAEVGYWVGEPFWGKGIMPKALSLITEYGFQKLGLHRIEAGVFEYNPASMRVLEKAGYQKETIKRDGAVKDGKIIDLHVYVKLSGK